MEDIVGKKVGYLTVERYLETIKSNGASRRIWLLRCVCGNTITQCTADINRSKARSCGCKRNEFVSIKNQDNIIGKKYGRLLVIGKSTRQTSGGTYYYICKCECGVTKEINGSSLRHGKTKSCGCLKIEMNMKKYDNKQSNGYYHSTRQQASNQKKHKEWRKKILEADNNQCQLCGRRSDAGLCVHHIYGWSANPELRFDLNNGITLCRTCHSKEHTLSQRCLIYS